MWGLPFESRCYLIYKLTYTLLHIYFWLMAAMFDLSVTPTSENIHTNITLLLDPKMWGSRWNRVAI